MGATKRHGLPTSRRKAGGFRAHEPRAGAGREQLRHTTWRILSVESLRHAKHIRSRASRRRCVNFASPTSRGPASWRLRCPCSCGRPGTTQTPPASVFRCALRPRVSHSTRSASANFSKLGRSIQSLFTHRYLCTSGLARRRLGQRPWRKRVASLHFSLPGYLSPTVTPIVDLPGFL